MGKYKTKKHLSLDICKNESWAKYNHKQNRTYKNVDDNWQEALEKMPREKKKELFFKYALEGNKKMLKAIYTSEGEPVDLNAKDLDGNNALMFALKSGRRDAIKYLLEIGIDVNYVNELGFSPLHFAVRKNNLGLVALLVDSGANVNIEGKNGETPLFDAVFENNGEMVFALVANGANVDARTKDGQTSLMRASENKSRQSAFRALIASGADVNMVDDYGKNALIRAIEHENNVCMDTLIKCGIDIDWKDNKGMTAVCQCAKMGNREALRVLVSKFANIFERDNNGRNAVEIAKHYKNHGCVDILEKATRIYESNMSIEQKTQALAKFGMQNKVANSCVK